MEEIEVPIEHLQEEIHEIAEHSRHEANQNKWFSAVALSSALLAALAAVAALMSGHHSNEALIELVHSSDHWNYYQAKGIKSAVLNSKIELLQGQGIEASKSDLAKLETYKKDQEKISESAEEAAKSSQTHLKTHQTLASAVTFFQVAIAISAISVLVRRRRFWYVSMGFGAVGLIYLIIGLR